MSNPHADVDAFLGMNEDDIDQFEVRAWKDGWKMAEAFSSGGNIVQPMPLDIVQSVVAIKAKIQKLEHDAENKHGGYKYTSGDAMYEALRKLMADVGLVIVAMETECDKAGDGKTIRATFQFILATEKATWTHTNLKRTQYQPWMGAQTFQAAQSYAEKAFLKNLFKLSTGEPETESVLQATQEAPKKKATKKKLDADTSGILATNIINTLADLKQPLSPEDKEAWTEKWAPDIDALTEDDKTIVREAFKKACKKP